MRLTFRWYSDVSLFFVVLILVTTLCCLVGCGTAGPATGLDTAGVLSPVMQRTSDYVLHDDTLTPDQVSITMMDLNALATWEATAAQADLAIQTSVAAVTFKHDAYVKRDAKLDQFRKDVFLKSSELSRQLVHAVESRPSFEGGTR